MAIYVLGSPVFAPEEQDVSSLAKLRNERSVGVQCYRSEPLNDGSLRQERHVEYLVNCTPTEREDVTKLQAINMLLLRSKDGEPSMLIP